MKKLVYCLIYNAHINSFLRPISKVFYKLTGKKLISVSGIIKLNFDNNTSFKLQTNQTSFVTQELFYNGAKAYEFTPLFAVLIKNTDVFLDIGANIGYFSILANKLNPNCKVVAFEPSLGSLHFLRENIELNGSKSIVVVDKAVSNLNGTLTFNEVTNLKYPWVKFNLNGSNSLAGEYIKSTFNFYDVQVTKIENVVEDLKLSSIDLIKLDTECTEHLILDCSVEVIQEKKPIIICEVYPVIEAEVENIILSKLTDYSIFQYKAETQKLIKIDTFQEILKSDLDRNFVFCPSSKLNLVQDFVVTKKG